MSHTHLPHDHGSVFARDEIAVPSMEDCVRTAGVFKALDDGTRLRIFWLLCHCEECVMNLSTLMDMSSPAVSHHLRQLKTSGLITSRREGKEVYYKAADTPQSRFLHRAIEEMMDITCPPESCQLSG